MFPTTAPRQGQPAPAAQRDRRGGKTAPSGTRAGHRLLSLLTGAEGPLASIPRRQLGTARSLLAVPVSAIRMLRHRTRPHTTGQRLAVLAVLALIAAIAATSTGIWHLAGPSSARETRPLILSTVAVAGLFAFAFLFVYRIPDFAGFALNEFPLVLALYFATPTALLWGSIAGASATFICHRQTPLKATFNTTLVAMESVVALAVFRAVAPSGGLHPLAWLGAYLATTVSGLLDAYLVMVVIGLHTRSLAQGPMIRSALRDAVLCGVVSTPGIVTACAVASDPRRWPLLAVTAAVLMAFFHKYAQLAIQRQRLEQMFGFTEQVSATPGLDQILRTVLRQVRDLFDCQQAEILLRPGDHTNIMRVQLDASDEIKPLDAEATTNESDLIVATALAKQQPTLTPHTTLTPEARRFLDQHHLRDAMLAPLTSSEGSVTGVLVVANRANYIRSFQPQHVRMLQTLAGQAGLALANTTLVDHLRHDAVHDALTGLPNRTLLARTLTEATDSAARDHTRLAVMIIDLDGFKRVNDTLGHACGDRVLVTAAHRMRDLVTDIAGEDYTTVARLGGDEFAVLLRNVPHPHHALRIGETLAAELHRPISANGTTIAIGASIGISLAPDHANDPSTLLRHADTAMYTAKTTRRGAQLYTDPGKTPRHPNP